MAAPDTTPENRLHGARLALALALLFVGGAIWGLSFPAAKLVTEAGAHPFGLSLIAGFFGGVILLSYCLARRRLPPLRRDYLVFYVVAGLLGTALPTAVLYSAAPHLPAGVLAIVIVLVPLMTYVFALGLGLERAEALRALGIVLGLLAILMIVVPEASLPHPAMVGWVLLALVVPASYASENLFIALRRPACQWRSKKGPPRRCKKGPLGGCGLVRRSPREGPARDAACPQQADAAARSREGPVGPRGQAWAGWSVQLAVGV